MSHITLHSAFTIMYHSNIVVFESSCSSSNIVVLVWFYLEQLEYPHSIILLKWYQYLLFFQVLQQGLVLNIKPLCNIFCNVYGYSKL